MPPTLIEHNRMSFMAQAVFLSLFWVWSANPEVLTLPLDQRPDWLSRDGIVMAGSWEALPMRARIYDSNKSFTPTPQQRAAYLREHSPEMIAKLKDLGVNFVMIHCHRGAGLQAERESMADAARFAERYHDAGLRVGVYSGSGTLFWELFFNELPQAKDWVLLGENGRPRTYGRATYRYFWNRNHPDAQAFYKQIVSFAVNEIRADLIHFDNYIAGPGWDTNSAQRFRRYLRDTFTASQLKEAGIDDLDTVQPPVKKSRDSLLGWAWSDFSCRSISDSYHQMGRYARALRRDILIECNPAGPGNYIRPPVDHGRLLQGGEAFWDETLHSGYYDGKLHTRIRTYKVARRMNNMAFAYTINPLEMAESMAFNRDCLGCICWYEYGNIVKQPKSEQPMYRELLPFIRFFRKRRDLLRDADVIADVAVLRSFPSQVFADPKHAELTYKTEQVLIDNRTCFQIIYNQHLDDLNHYRTLVLAGCVALSDYHVKLIKQYVKSGGQLCVIGPVATHDEWMFPRKDLALSELPDSQVVQIAADGDILAAVRQACDNKPSLSINAGLGLRAELTKQTDRRLVHLVNYESEPIENVEVTLRLPDGCRVETVTLVSPERHKDLSLPFEAQDDCVQFNVPAVGVYEIAIVDMK